MRQNDFHISAPVTFTFNLLTSKMILLFNPDVGNISLKLRRLYHSLEWYTRVYTTPDYGITYLFHDRRARANMGLRLAR